MDGGGDVMTGTVGNNADALYSSSSTARGAADGRSTSFGGTPSRSTSLETLGTQLSCHQAIDSAPQGLETLQWLHWSWLHFHKDPRMFTHTLPR